MSPDQFATEVINAIEAGLVAQAYGQVLKAWAGVTGEAHCSTKSILYNAKNAMERQINRLASGEPASWGAVRAALGKLDAVEHCEIPI